MEEEPALYNLLEMVLNPYYKGHIRNTVYLRAHKLKTPSQNYQSCLSKMVKEVALVES